MMVSVQSTGALERRMEVAVPASRIEKAVDERLRTVSRTARLKGFRPGKAPLKVIRQQFGSQIHREVVSELLQSSFAEAVTEQKAEPRRRAAHRADQCRRGPGSQVHRDLRGLPGSHDQGARQHQHRTSGGERHRRRRRCDDREPAQAAPELESGGARLAYGRPGDDRLYGHD